MKLRKQMPVKESREYPPNSREYALWGRGISRLQQGNLETIGPVMTHTTVFRKGPKSPARAKSARKILKKYARKKRAPLRVIYPFRGVVVEPRGDTVK